MELTEIKAAIIRSLADGQFHSGTSLSKQLKVSRSAIWKHLNFLSEIGIELVAVNGKGYRLKRPLELLNKKIIYAAFSEQTKNAVDSFTIHHQLDSTNNYLVTQAPQGLLSGAICLAEYQTAGRGRRGRQWVSPFGSNIYLSLLWRYQCGPAALSALSLVIGIAVIRALQQFAIHDVGLKWPNDIYWQGKKLGGILVELSGETEGPCRVVMGLGLNFFLSDKNAANIDQQWTDLSQILGQDKLPSRNELAAELINQLIAVIALFDQQGISQYIQEWRSLDCMKGEQVILHNGAQKISGKIMGVDESGLLQLLHADGSVKVYASGEVSFNRHDN